MVYGEVVLAEEVRAARQKAFTHILLGLVGGAVAGWIWTDPWGLFGILPGLRGIMTFLAAAATLYELSMGVLAYQKASHLAAIPGAAPGPTTAGAPCRRCARPLLPGAGECAVCGEPAFAGSG